SAVTNPAVMLARAAEHIAEGHLDQPITVTGEDEIGKASQAFERMRQKLRARLDELDLLLRVSQRVAGSLNLDDALPTILDGALGATNASGARIVLVAGDERFGADTSANLPDVAGGPGSQTYAAGGAANLMAPLDRG